MFEIGINSNNECGSSISENHKFTSLRSYSKILITMALLLQ